MKLSLLILCLSAVSANMCIFLPNNSIWVGNFHLIHLDDSPWTHHSLIFIIRDMGIHNLSKNFMSGWNYIRFICQYFSYWFLFSIAGDALWRWKEECYVLHLQLGCCDWLWGGGFLVPSVERVPADGRHQVHVLRETFITWRKSSMVHHLFCFIMVRTSVVHSLLFSS